MALTKETVVSQISTDEEGRMSVRFATYILEDGKRISMAEYHRMPPLEPGDPVPNFATTPHGVIAVPREVRDIAAIVATPARIARATARRAAALQQ